MMFLYAFIRTPDSILQKSVVNIFYCRNCIFMQRIIM